MLTGAAQVVVGSAHSGALVRCLIIPAGVTDRCVNHLYVGLSGWWLGRSAHSGALVRCLVIPVGVTGV